MKRLTTDTPSGNFETMLNYVYGKDGWAHIRHDGENADVPLTEWARKQCLSHGCDEFPAETSAEIDQEICDCMMDYPECLVTLAYCFASQAVHLRSRLKQYEDILFSEDGTELVSLDELREAVKEMVDNPPLTLEELRKMDGEPVWCVNGSGDKRWAIVCVYGESPDDFECYTTQYGRIPGWCYGMDGGDGWLAYRRKPEEGTK